MLSMRPASTHSFMPTGCMLRACPQSLSMDTTTSSRSIRSISGTLRHFSPTFGTAISTPVARSTTRAKSRLTSTRYQRILRPRRSLPVNLRILIEGEEESGGRHIKAFLQSSDKRLSADFAQVADSSFFNRHTPSVLSGLRGIVYAEVRVRANRQDLHSGEYGGVAPNPFISLAHVISRLRDDRGQITIPGFYDQVQTPTHDETASWKLLDMSEEKLAAEIGARKLMGDPAFSPLERMWSRPTLDVHGMPGGFTAPGAKTVIPAEASAKISMRLVPDQKADRIFESFETAVRRSAPDDVTVAVERIHGDDPVIVPSDTPPFARRGKRSRRCGADRPYSPGRADRSPSWADSWTS